MRFTPHSWTVEEEPPRVAQCLPRQIGSTGPVDRATRPLDDDPPGGGAGGVQDPLPGLEAPPCR